MMKKVVLTAVAVALSATASFAADMKMVTKAAPPPPPPSPWDIAFGGALMSDYIWRGITQSNHEPSVAAYFEPRYNINPNLQLYAGVSGESISFPNRAAMELDTYGGIRPTFGPLAFDIGIWGYWYPGGQEFSATSAQGFLPNGNVAKKDWSFYEVYGHVTWTINDMWAIGGNLFYSPDILHTGADGTYLSGTVKFTAPSTMALAGGAIGWYVSGEVGEQWLGNSDIFYGTGVVGSPFQNSVPYADYLTWNVGVGFTWKVFTLDLRYYDTDLSKANCNVYTSDHTASFAAGSVTLANPLGLASNWCDSRFVAKLSFDMTLGSLK
jgi:uncharacterized protein (TIGR02001 family)